jgi:hypothetical protein
MNSSYLAEDGLPNLTRFQHDSARMKNVDVHQHVLALEVQMSGPDIPIQNVFLKLSTHNIFPL